jgi:hypothetical protein
LHPPLDHNPTTKLWGCLASNVIIDQKLLKYHRLVELGIVMVLNNVNDEKTFSIINFMKYKFRNHLAVHLKCMPKNFTSLKLSYELHNNLGMGSKEKLH